MKQNILHKYFKGDATIEEEKEILDWAESSDENRKNYLNERLIFDTSLFANSKANSVNKRVRIMPALRWSLRIAALFALILGGSHILNEYIYDQNALLQTITVPAGQRAQITLADGTSIWLNSKSTLSYNSNFGKKERNVILDGEAYFEVAKNKEIPFFVNTEKNSVKVVGTTFNVYAYNNTNEFETSLIEGIVDIYEKGNKQVLTRLEKNQYLSIKGTNKTKGYMKSTDFLRWKDGLYCFDDTPFECILHKLKLYYGINITVKKPEILNYRCTGKFKQKDGAEHILKVIQKDHPFTYRINEEKDSVIIW